MENEYTTQIPQEIYDQYAEEDWNPVFIAYGCLLIERYTGKTYVYDAVNLKTGKSKRICSRVAGLSRNSYSQTAGKVKQCEVSDSCYRKLDFPPGERCTYEELKELLVLIFERFMPEYGYSVREKQAELAGEILETLKQRGVALSEAEVGIGKTYAYIIAAALIKRGRLNDFWTSTGYGKMKPSASKPIVISTSSIALQKAIIEDYIPKISNILMDHEIISNPLTCVMRKGKEHYICDTRLRQYIRQYADAKEKKFWNLCLQRIFPVLTLGKWMRFPVIKRTVLM